MTQTWAKPSEKELQTAFRDHRVNFRVHPKERSRDHWANGLRAVTCHHTAGKNSSDYLASAWSLPGANCCITNGHYNPTDGLLIVLAWGSAFHTGAGGPWSGVSARDSLHLVSWGAEIESLGTKRDITDAQIETVGRMLAALWEVAGIRGNTHRHEDWTDGSGPVGGYPLATNGRKIDTRDDLGYSTKFWLAQGDKFVARPMWDGHVPAMQAVLTAQNTDAASPAAYRVAARLHDMGYYTGAVRPVGEQRYPRRAVQKLQREQPGGLKAKGTYGPATHKLIFG